MRQINYILAVVFFLLFGIQSSSTAQDREKQACIEQYQKGQLLYQDNFDQGLGNWVVETPDSPNSSVTTENERLIIDVDHGATVWLNKKLSGNVLIEYHREMIMNNGQMIAFLI